MRRLLCCLLLLVACVSEVVLARRGLESADPIARMAGARKLGELRDKVAVPKLCELLSDKVPAVRAEAANALGRIAASAAVEPLTEAALAETVEVVAVVETEALAGLGGKAIDGLIRLLRVGFGSVRASAARGLGRLQTNRAVDWLIPMLRDPDPRARKAAALALRRIGDPRGAEALARRLERGGPMDDEPAGEALGDQPYEAQLEQARRLVKLGLRLQ